MTTVTMSNTQFRDLQTDENNNPKSKECLLIRPSREINFEHLKTRFAADLTLTNKKDEPVLYKIRTTSAKSYVVLPTIGLLPPHETVAVKIYMPKTEQVKERLNDKFLIQAFPYKGNDLGDDVMAMTQVFDHFYKSLSSKEFQNSKLRVYFESHTVIEEEASEDGTPARHINPLATSFKSNGVADSNSFSKSKSDNNSKSPLSKTQQPNQVLSLLAPETEFAARKEDKTTAYPDFTRVLPDDAFDTFRPSSVNRSISESHRNLTPEPHSYSTPYRTEQETLAPSFRGNETMNVVKNLKDEFERDTVRNSLTNITAPVKKDFNTSYSVNDVSIHTEFSDLRSDISLSEQLSVYKRRLHLLEGKFNEQKALMDQLTQEKDRYQKEAQNLRRNSASLSTTADETKLEQNGKHKLDVWHLIILCVACMILGSLFR